MRLQAPGDFLRAANVGIIILCLVFFAAQFRIIMIYYSQGKTNTAISYETHKMLELPHITICPQVPNKDNSKIFLEEDYQSKSYVLSDYMNIVSRDREPTNWRHQLKNQLIPTILTNKLIYFDLKIFTEKGQNIRPQSPHSSAPLSPPPKKKKKK